ncbi:MAG: CBS domain-containing protein [Planctomycetaceae bacterium]|nr:CBS domain-containing protein [Planctomycetaceae bacterium]
MTKLIGEIVETRLTISHRSSITAAIEIMARCQSDRIYLTGDDGRVRGTIPDYKIIKAYVRGELQTQTLSDLASPLGETLESTQPLLQAAVFFRDSRAVEIPVFSGDQFLGVVRRTRFLQELLNVELSEEPQTTSHTPRETSDCLSSAPILTGLINLKSRKTG